MTGLKGKIAIVTGGGSGLGEAIAKRLAGHGVKVVVSDIKVESAERVAKPSPPPAVPPAPCSRIPRDPLIRSESSPTPFPFMERSTTR
jgi:nucleoside-diphosphate-sugar epimerase